MVIGMLIKLFVLYVNLNLQISELSHKALIDSIAIGLIITS